MIKTILQSLVTAALVQTFVTESAEALQVPFSEEFIADSANWYDSSSISPVGWAMSGGPDGSSYATTTFNFVSSSSGATPALFRAQDKWNTSGGAFQGDWITGDVQRFTAFVRHDAGIPLSFFVRFSDPANFPGVVSVISSPIPSGEWRYIKVSIPDPDFVYEGPFGFNDVFDNIGHVQIGVIAPESLIGIDQNVTFDLDSVTILNNVPAVSTWGLLALALSIGIGGTLMPRRESALTVCKDA